MQTQFAKPYSGAMLDIVREFLDAGGAEPLDLDEVARFAVNHGHWKPQPGKVLQMCRRDLARALRQQSHTDPQGRSVRTYHPAKRRAGDSYRDRVLWADIRTAPGAHMEVSFQQRRQQIVGDCRRLKTDVDSFNDNNQEGVQIQTSFDFTEDLRELDQPTEYRPTRPR